VSEREQFEAWAKSNGLDVLPAPHWANLTFQSLPTEDSWRGWQASRRAALEEAAKICDESAAAWDETAKGNYDGTYDSKADAARECAADIRALAKETNNG
jgi:hypothetical protein